MLERITVKTRGQGLYSITPDVERIVESARVSEGVCTVFIQHTSASLIIQENADPTAKRDLERWLNRLVSEDPGYFTHTSEGPDDMPSHIKSVLTATSLSIPVMNGTPALGTWQGIYVWEHRKTPHTRTIIVHVIGA